MATRTKYRCRKGLGIFFVCLISLIFAFSYYAFVIELCIFTVQSSVEKGIYLGVSNFLFFMSIWSYFETISTKPATPPKKFHVSKRFRRILEANPSEEIKQKTLHRAIKGLPIITRDVKGDIRYCEICHLLKPDRCYHCPVCNVCVLKLDHHCIFLNNCVGFSNYKFFILTLLYTLFYSLFISAACLQYVIKFWLGDLPDIRSGIAILVAFILSIVIIILLGFLFYNHSCVLSEFSVALDNPKVFKVSCRKHFIEAFGDRKICWPFPIFSSLEDGYSFPTDPDTDDIEKNVNNIQNDSEKPVDIIKSSVLLKPLKSKGEANEDMKNKGSSTQNNLAEPVRSSSSLPKKSVRKSKRSKSNKKHKKKAKKIQAVVQTEL